MADLVHHYFNGMCYTKSIPAAPARAVWSIDYVDHVLAGVSLPSTWVNRWRSAPSISYPTTKTMFVDRMAADKSMFNNYHLFIVTYEQLGKWENFVEFLNIHDSIVAKSEDCSLNKNVHRIEPRLYWFILKFNPEQLAHWLKLFSKPEKWTKKASPLPPMLEEMWEIEKKYPYDLREELIKKFKNDPRRHQHYERTWQ